MSFATAGFVAFFAALFLLYYAIPKKHQWKLLLAGSLVFYWFAGWRCLVFIGVTAFTTWFSALRIDRLASSQTEALKAEEERRKAAGDPLTKEERKARKAADKKVRWRWALGCMLLNFGILAVMKYTGFLLSIVGVSFRGFAAVMGISFYTFQSMGYLIDVYWGKVPAEKDPARFALFVTFFPQLIQGPISRYGDLAKSLYAEHEWDDRTIGRGALRVVWGFAKKLIIADRLAIPLKILTQNPDSYTGGYVALVVVLYAAELYADFTGGIDITIGCANMLGIDVAENFDRPFFSKNTAEYWRRWHITMGTWFRDYVFYPLSTAKGMLRLHKKCSARFGAFGRKITVYLTTLLLWFVTGVWHGAAWNFIVWGLLNGVVILVSQELEPLYAKYHGRFPRLKETKAYGLFEIARTFCLMSLIRVFDVYRDVPLTFRQIGTIVTGGPAVSFGELGLTAADWAIALIGIAGLYAASIIGIKEPARDRLVRRPLLAWAGAIALIAAIIVFGIYGIGYDSTAFIYNQF